ncbi:hypothetical protein N7462_000838 [Penicillium macrosclerotiorum]|uniref:uncharacterized protein n=1 Tax=Penicillium macrosclerotiorum TaxID=303699 RepID=UPI0025483E33|nr:uncharacterized protein N7462_000838 [Penicillium macrosclerotiorum]KAJ5698833.1 hypothetical protein N7462_000838 [Penicillium macrosclerotiorum]
MQTRTTLARCTPLATSSTESVVHTLHNHGAMIEQNPLVIHYERCAPPADAPPDEADAIWYELTDRIAILPWGLLQGKVRYRACFHDTPQGLRTHIYAPMGVNIRNYWSVVRRSEKKDPPAVQHPEQPRSPEFQLEGQEGQEAEEGQEAQEGQGDPEGGLFLQEQVDLRCPWGMTGFVRRTLTQAHQELVARLAVAGGF